MKKLKRMYRCIEELKSENDKTTGCPTKTFGHDKQCGFTLVELVIVIAIVIILSVVSVPIYRGYVEKAKYSEGYALLGTILSAQKSYYSEYGNFYSYLNGVWTQYDPTLGIDAKGNKYFTRFHFSGSNNDSNLKYYFYAGAGKDTDLVIEGALGHVLYLQYNTTKGARYLEGPEFNKSRSEWE